MKWILALIALALAATVFPATMLIVALGILPTFATALGDNSGDRRAVLAIGVPNLAGMLPVLLSLWQNHSGPGIDAAYALLLQPFTWLLLYGGAGLGLMIYNLVPRGIVLFASARAEAGIEAREAYQQALERVWGKAIRTDAAVASTSAAASASAAANKQKDAQP